MAPTVTQVFNAAQQSYAKHAQCTEELNGLLDSLPRDIFYEQLFGRVALGEHLSAEANFCTFPTAVLTMFRCATGEGWNGILHDVMITPASGRCSVEAGDCGSPYLAGIHIGAPTRD